MLPIIVTFSARPKLFEVSTFDEFCLSKTCVLLDLSMQRPIKLQVWWAFAIADLLVVPFGAKFDFSAFVMLPRSLKNAI